MYVGQITYLLIWVLRYLICDTEFHKDYAIVCGKQLAKEHPQPGVFDN